eukprot:422250-Amphidinium_carterae.1
MPSEHQPQKDNRGGAARGNARRNSWWRIPEDSVASTRHRSTPLSTILGKPKVSLRKRRATSIGIYFCVVPEHSTNGSTAVRWNPLRLEWGDDQQPTSASGLAG